jgi:hypothetical protein
MPVPPPPETRVVPCPQRESAVWPKFLLPENVSVNIICGSLVSCQQDVRQFRIDVSCPEVQIRAIMTGSGAFGRSFLKRREAQEPFLFATGPQSTNS